MNILKNIILVILIILVGYNIFTNNSIRTDVEAYNRKIDSLQNEIDSVETANKVLDTHIAKVDDEIKRIYLSDRERLIGQMFLFMCNTGVPYGDLILLNFTNLKIEKEELTELKHLEEIV